MCIGTRVATADQLPSLYRIDNYVTVTEVTAARRTHGQLTAKNSNKTAKINDRKFQRSLTTVVRAQMMPLNQQI